MGVLRFSKPRALTFPGKGKRRRIVSYFYDLFPLAAADLSLRKKRAGHTQAVRVRAASGTNAGNDKIIGFDSNGELDIADLENWCDGGDGFVNKWFDATGNGNAATQTTASNQPKIVISGSVITNNGKPTIWFDGMDDYLIAPWSDLFGSTIDDFVILNVFSIRNTSELQVPYRQTNGGSSRGDNLNSITVGYRSNRDNFYRVNSTSFNGGGADLEFGQDQVNLVSLQKEGETARVYKNGGLVNAKSTNQTLEGDVPNQYYETWIGANGGFNNFFEGNHSEFIIYSQSPSSFLSNIQSNITSHFSI